MRRSVPMGPPLAAAVVAAVLAALAGMSWVASSLLGLVVAGVAAMVAVSRQPAPERIEPTQVGEPWRHRVSAALAARRRFDRAVDAAAPGPLRDRMNDVASRLDEAVRECWEVARRGHRLDQAIDELGVRRIRSQLESLGPVGDGDEHKAALASSLRAQLDAADRLVTVSERTHERLRLLNARMDEAVARAVELAAPGPGAAVLQPVNTDLEGLVLELKALEAALEETGRA